MVKMLKAQKFKILLSGTFMVVMCPFAWGECVAFVEGPIVFDATQCQKVDPLKDMDWQDEAFLPIKTMPESLKQQLISKYRGMMLKGKVVQSRAVRKGLGTTGVLEGQEIQVFAPTTTHQCAAFQNLRLQAELKEACCDGSAEVPCMLKTSYYFSTLKAIGRAGGSAGNDSRRIAEKDPRFIEAASHLKKRDFKAAVKPLEAMRREQKLHLRGYYLLATAYHRQEQCKKAIAPLEFISDKARAKEAWADDDSIIRQAELLLARCYSRTFDVGKTMVILESYLLNPPKYQNELRQSLRAPEFGAINASKEYKQYRSEAEKALKTLTK